MNLESSVSCDKAAPCEAFLDRVLDPPHYGYAHDDGTLIKPDLSGVRAEFFSRMNVLKDVRTWLPAFAWFCAFLLIVPTIIFFAVYFSWSLFIVAFIYSMVVLGTHGTVWLHRYGTHRAFQIKSPFWRVVVRNLTVRVIPEEVYIVSHHVHHFKSEKPGDPYNPRAGWWYSFLSDANHHNIRRDLSEEDYKRIVSLLSHTGIRTNTYQEYKKFGTVSRPLTTILHYALNWSFWLLAFYLVGGLPLAFAVFAGCGVWAFGVRTFNYEGHGRGKDLRKAGVDFNRADCSVNQIWPGYVSGEWHNNHHLYPNSARAGFLPYQLDLAWCFIWVCQKLGIVTGIRDSKAEFLRVHYQPYLESQTSIKYN